MGSFECSLGHLLSQYSSWFGSKAAAKALELCEAGGRGYGEIRVKEVVEERITETWGD